MEDKHTPDYWHKLKADETSLATVRFDDGSNIDFAQPQGTYPQRRERAEFIVRCVNSHYELLKLAKLGAEELKLKARYYPEWNRHSQLAQELITKAEGKQQ